MSYGLWTISFAFALSTEEHLNFYNSTCKTGCFASATASLYGHGFVRLKVISPITLRYHLYILNVEFVLTSVVVKIVL